MRLHIYLEDDLVAEIDQRVGPRQRSGFITEAVRRALDDERRWELIESAVGVIPSTGHPWDEDPEGWVQAEREADRRRIG